jgi:hypothetical protein
MRARHLSRSILAVAVVMLGWIGRFLGTRNGRAGELSEISGCCVGVRHDLSFSLTLSAGWAGLIVGRSSERRGADGLE